MKLHIKNAKLLCPDGVFRPGELLISNGRIESAGDMLSRPDGTDITVINAEGRYVTPGLIDGHCHVGIMEEGVGTPGDDANETSALCTPQMRAEDSLKVRLAGQAAQVFGFMFRSGDGLNHRGTSLISLCEGAKSGCRHHFRLLTIFL